MGRRYICYEVGLCLTKKQWEEYFNEADYIDREEYPDFSVWWYDMYKVGLIVPLY